MVIWNKIKNLYRHNPLRFITYSTVGVVAAIPLAVMLFIFVNFAQNDFNLNSMYFDGVRPTLIVTDSMEPVIMTNAIIMVEDVEPSVIEPGDIIRYNSSRGFSIVHRVIAIDMREGYFITKGDNSRFPDNELVYPDMVNGRVAEINNDVAPYITVVFGKIDRSDWSGSLRRAGLGLIVSALVLAGILLGLYAIFEIITISHFWLKKSNKMQDSLDWTDDTVTRDKFNRLVENYRAEYYKSGLLKRIYLRCIFMKYYDILCTVEKHSKRASRWKNHLDKLVDNHSEDSV